MAQEKGEKVKLQVMVSRETAEKIEHLASLMGGSTSGVANRLLEHALADEAWVVEHIVVPLKKGIESFQRLLKGSTVKRGKVAGHA